MKNKIKDLLFQGQSVGGDGEIGIEIEVEGKQLPYIDSKYWRTEADGSLRAAESYEYIINNPIKREKVQRALSTLQSHWDKNNAIIDDSYRAGVHVHINVRELTLKQMVTFSLLYYLFEDILLEWCGEDRVGNHFCLSSKDAEFVLFELEKAIVKGDLHRLHSDQIRYSSLNFKALVQYGSLEFRGMRSTRNLKDIEDWVSILLCLKDFAVKTDNPVKIIEMMSLNGAKGLCRKVFNGRFIDEDNLNLDAIHEGMRRVQSVAYCSDWEDKLEDCIHIPFDFEVGHVEEAEVQEDVAIAPPEVFDHRIIMERVQAMRHEMQLRPAPKKIRGLEPRPIKWEIN